MNDVVFQLYSDFYDLLYRDKDYAREVDYVVRILRAWNPTARTLLEFGSGTGRHGRLLAEQGFEVFGVERSETMVAAAKRMSRELQSSCGGAFDCINADVRSVDLNSTFDAVVALFHVVSYQTTNDDLLQTFNAAARHLTAGGMFLFDVWHGPAVLAERPSVRVKRAEDEGTLLTRIAEPELDTNTSVVTVRYTILAESKTNSQLTRFHEEHRMRYLFPMEIELIARQSGFIVERSEEFVTGELPSDSTWGVTYLLRRKTE